MKSGELARRAEVNPQTLRYYERRGLLRTPRRRRNGYRDYGEGSVARVRFIKRAQRLGFDLGEIEQLLALRDGPGRDPRAVRRLAEGKIEEIEQKIEELTRMRDALGMLVDDCVAHCNDRRCPILEALAVSEELRP